jgi:hypothetical protein
MIVLFCWLVVVLLWRSAINLNISRSAASKVVEFKVAGVSAAIGFPFLNLSLYSNPSIPFVAKVSGKLFQAKDLWNLKGSQIFWNCRNVVIFMSSEKKKMN